MRCTALCVEPIHISFFCCLFVFLFHFICLFVCFYLFVRVSAHPLVHVIMHACDTQVRSSLATRPHGFEDAALRVASVQAGPRSTQRGRGSSVDRGRARVQLSCVHRQARADGHCWQFHVGQVAPCAPGRRYGLGESVTAMPATESMA